MRLPLSYLTEQTTIEKAIAENTRDGKTFGHSEDDWLRLLAKRRKGDELWNFAPPSHEVIQLWGLALVRDGRVISTVIIAVN